MYLKDLWHIKIGTRVEALDSLNKTILKGTVIRRQVDDEMCGFFLAHDKKTNKVIEKDFKTGKKYLTVTVRFDNGSIRYYDTLPPFYRLERLSFSK